MGNPPSSFEIAHQTMTSTTIVINQASLEALLALTPSQQEQGLGGFTSLGPNQAMYFPLLNQPNASFWMKGMLIPIDIVWIKNHAITSINQNIPPPRPNTPDSQLPTYHSAVPNPDAVLEIAAHRSTQLGLKAGDEVIVHPQGQ
jgi:hypothetical protein